VHTAPSAHRFIKQGVTAVTVAIFAAGLLMGVSGSALAASDAHGASTPTLSQAEAQLTKLETQFNQLDQQYDQVQQELQAANQRLGVINEQKAAYERSFAAEQQEIGRIAVTQYEDGNLNTSLTLLTSGKPQQILDQSSILLELSTTNTAQIHHFLTAARQLRATQILAQRTRVGIAQLDDSLAAQRANMNKLISQQNTLVAQLSAQEVAALEPGQGTTSAVYTGPTGTQADTAVQFAYDQLGCPYVFGGTGPCADGFDCSGLTQAAWADAGIAIPRTTYEQWDDLPHTSTLEPGDIMEFAGESHVAIYVGNNELIDAPQTGEDVELTSFTGWFAANYDGALVP
jgi:cell wall-associated NlpC family hydrolase